MQWHFDRCIGETPLCAVSCLAASGLLRVTIGRSDNRGCEHLSAIAIDAIAIELLTSSAENYRASAFAEVEPLVRALIDDADVMANDLRREKGRLALMHRLGMETPSKVLDERHAWQRAITAARPWDPARFREKVVEFIEICRALGSEGPHVRVACVRVAERALPWPLDDLDELWRAFDIARIVETPRGPQRGNVGRVADLVNRSREANEWATPYGHDVRRAWAECPKSAGLALMALNLGAEPAVVEEAMLAGTLAPDPEVDAAVRRAHKERSGAFRHEHLRDPAFFDEIARILGDDRYRHRMIQQNDRQLAEIRARIAIQDLVR